MKPSLALSIALLPILLAAACSRDPKADAALASTAVPTFQPDTTWLADFPKNWLLSAGTGVYVDAMDHVWILHRPEQITPERLAEAAALRPTVADCCVAAPPLIELDPAGRVVHTYGSIEPNDKWPYLPHGVFVDHNDFVWVTNGSSTHTLMKFTRAGEHLLTIGTYDKTGGNDNHELLGGAADSWVDPETNELFVADGYVNKRVIVFDASTGAFVRQWGAYGNAPVDNFQLDSTATEPPSQFSIVHGIAGSKDGLVYVADATTSRIQAFRRNGEFVQEGFIDGRSAPNRITDVAFSPDPEQRWVYVSDGSDDKVWILRRADLSVVGSFGTTGTAPGQFRRPHNIATDSKGNIYVAETTNRRFQKFTPSVPAAP